MPGHGSLRTRWAAIGAAIAVSLGGGITLGAHAAGGGGGGGNTYTPITPCRLMDTRGGDNTVGTRNAPIGAGESHVATVHGTNGNCTIPTNATGIATNTTVLNGTSASFLTLYPANASRPLASNLNWTAGQPATPNQVTVGLSPDGRIRIYNDRGTVNVIIDIVGIYTDLGIQRRSIELPAQALNIPTGSVIQRSDAGLLWQNSFGSSARVNMRRPVDAASTGDVKVTVTFRRVNIDEVGNVQFALRPRRFHAGDFWDDATTTSSNVVNVVDNRWHTATMSVAFTSLDREIWELSLQRDSSVAGALPANIVVYSVSIEYDAYR